MTAVNSDGSLIYAAGSIAIHLFSRDYIERITSGGSLSLPFHVARKKIKKYTPQGPAEIDGFKFEKFVFDALPLAGKSVIMECLREEEFGPVKNASGVDSVETSRKLMSDLFRSWFATRGITVPPAVRVLEISPIVAVAPEDLPVGMKIPAEENVYIG
jgi:UDP-N-acetylglucosamine/UDP-N-acetylgalactosamine diphosphorylase